MKAELDQLPLFIRGGSIVSTRERTRRSSTLMKLDPFTLRIALDSKNSARGELYLDDGESYAHTNGDIVWREFTATAKGSSVRISSADLVSQKKTETVDGVALTTYDRSNAFANSIASVKVERIVILGLGAKPSSVKTDDGRSLEWAYEDGIASSGKKEGTASVLTIKNPGVYIAVDWSIAIEL